MIRLGAFFGSEFNQNGDLGNVHALNRALSAHNSVEMFPNLQKTSELVEVDFLVVGDASLAHQRARRVELDSLADSIAIRNQLAKWTLVVGSSYRALANRVFAQDPEARTSRISGFYSTLVSGDRYWGYINTDQRLPAVLISGSIIGTDFFGPFLARNPDAIEMICARNGWKYDAEYIELLRSFAEASPNFAEALKHPI